MRKIFFTVALVATLLVLTSGYPSVSVPEVDRTLDESFLLDLDSLVESPSSVTVPHQEENVRVKRFTCDVLSGLGWNHAPCALHCSARGNKGGYCNGKGVCVCRN